MKKEKAWKIILNESEKEMNKLGNNLEDISKNSSFAGYCSDMSEEETYKELGRLTARISCPILIEEISYYENLIQKCDTLTHFIKEKSLNVYAKFLKGVAGCKKEAIEQYLSLESEKEN